MTEQGLVSTVQVLRKRRTAWFLRLTSAKGAGRYRSLLVLGPGAAGIAGFASRESTVAVIVAVLVWLLDVVGRWLLQKRRDDVFADTVRKGEDKTDIMRAISIYEAVRSRQLTSDAIVRLLRPPEADAALEKAPPEVVGEEGLAASDDARLDR